MNINKNEIEDSAEKKRAQTRKGTVNDWKTAEIWLKHATIKFISIFFTWFIFFS